MPHDPKRVAGIGCTAAADAQAILALLDRCLAEVGATRAALVAIVTTVRRRSHPGLRDAASALGVPLRVLDDAALAAQRTAGPSVRVEHLSGLPSVAEAAALCAGPLVLEKRIGEGVTCALAAVPVDFDPQALGAPA